MQKLVDPLSMTATVRSEEVPPYRAAFTETPRFALVRKTLIVCGILSSLLYVAANVVVPMQFDGYSLVSQTVSELSAIDAPTRQFWLMLMVPYGLFLIAFGLGVWWTASGSRALRATGVLFITHGVIGYFWPPMHQRGAPLTVTDTMHIVFTLIVVPIMMLQIAFGAAALGKQFRIYSVVTFAAVIFFGILTGFDGPRIAADLPTPWVGVWERICIASYMLWVIVFAVALLRRENNQPGTNQDEDVQDYGVRPLRFFDSRLG